MLWDHFGRVWPRRKGANWCEPGPSERGRDCAIAMHCTREAVTRKDYEGERRRERMDHPRPAARGGWGAAERAGRQPRPGNFRAFGSASFLDDRKRVVLPLGRHGDPRTRYEVPSPHSFTLPLPPSSPALSLALPKTPPFPIPPECMCVGADCTCQKWCWEMGTGSDELVGRQKMAKWRRGE
jgi:hypothetical protein